MRCTLRLFLVNVYFPNVSSSIGGFRLGGNHHHGLTVGKFVHKLYTQKRIG